LFAELLGSSAEPVILHGDLHHNNILRDGDAWLAIDPKGVLGEAAYETGALLRNPASRIAITPNLPQLLARRVDLLAEQLDLPRDRLAAWGEAQAVLSAWWTIEDGGPDRDWQQALRIADALEGVTTRRPKQSGKGASGHG
jgi:streptomycin 6-kinase